MTATQELRDLDELLDGLSRLSSEGLQVERQRAADDFLRLLPKREELREAARVERIHRETEECGHPGLVHGIRHLPELGTWVVTCDGCGLRTHERHGIIAARWAVFPHRHEEHLTGCHTRLCVACIQQHASRGCWDCRCYLSTNY